MDDAESVETTMEETTVVAEEPRRRRSGPGFLLGVTLGALAGAAVATLLVPTPEEALGHNGERPAEPELAPEAGPADRLRSALTRFRRNLSEASMEGHHAAQEAEEHLRARFNELTQ
jgi:hypothetical protein